MKVKWQYWKYCGEYGCLPKSEDEIKIFSDEFQSVLILGHTVRYQSKFLVHWKENHKNMKFQKK